MFEARCLAHGLVGGLMAGLVAAQASAVTLGLASDLPTPMDGVSIVPLGNTVTVDVQLSGLGAGDALDELAAEVMYGTTLLSAATVSTGAIVPDPTGFAPGGTPGFADGSWDGLFAQSNNDQIVTNGVFYSFTTTTQALGTGAFEFVSTAATGETGGGAEIDGAQIGTSRLDFRVAVPGDANLDDVVDQHDVTVLAAAFDQSGNWSQGDFNDDQQVDLLDLTILGTYYGYGTTPSVTFLEAVTVAGLASVIPEPAVAPLALLAGCFIRRRR